MANGTRKPISEVKEGDYVYATNPETGETGGREVIATMPHTDQLLTLRTSSGDIVTTEDHRYWNETDGEWQESQHLDAGDYLLSADGGIVTVEGLDWSTVHTDAAHDLDVADLDSFYVGAGDESVLIHNQDPCDAAADAFARRARINNVSSPTVTHRHLSVDEFIGQFRKGSVRAEMPGEFMDLTVEEALLSGNSTVRKLLTSGQYAQ